MTKKVLVVDDEADARTLMGDLLKIEGYKVYEAEDGKTCLEMMKKNKYDLILLDVMMPDITGEEVLKIIRGEGDKTLVVYVTVKRKKEVNTRHADGFVGKPFSNQNLIEVIKKTLSN